MQAENTIGATGTPSDAGAGNTAGSTPSPTTESNPQPQTSAPTEQAAGGATADVQGATTNATEPDVLEGVPSLDELNQLSDETTYKKSLVQMRRAIEEQFKPRVAELTEKWSKFEPVADRFESADQLTELVQFREQLFGYERDDSNQLVPSTQQAATYLAEKYPDHADFLTADLLEMPTKDPDTGRTLPRIDLVLETWKDIPEKRTRALQILGGVEPTAIAPTWQPSAEELDAITVDAGNLTTEDKQLQDIYRKLPYDERENLRINDPEFVRSYLKKEQFQQNLIAQNQQAQEREARTLQAREQQFRQQVETAGNSYVEQGFRQGMTEFSNSIVERSKFIQPLDPQSQEAQQLPPEQVAATNQQIQRINTGVGKMVAVVTAALAVPDTAWVAAEFLKGIGVDDKVLQGYDTARLKYARSGRDFAELEYQHKQGQHNGSGLGDLQSNSDRAMKEMKGHANAVAGSLLTLLSEFFEMKAGSYNATLNSAPSARPSLQGNGFDPTKAPLARPTGWQSREEIQRQFGG